MKITLSELKRVVRDVLLSEAAYDVPIDVVKRDWSSELSDAVKFMMCHMDTSENNARAHIMNNWSFDTLEHEGHTFLLAHDASEDKSLAYHPKAGGWYFRLGGNDEKCRQTGPGSSSSNAKSGVRDRGQTASGGTVTNSTSAKTVLQHRGPTGTKASRYA